MTQIHIMKLLVGIDTLTEYMQWCERAKIDYNGTPAIPCWTRYKPKQADEILRTGGSIYRVIKNRILCRHLILGFEMVETGAKGTMCMIVQDANIIETVHMPRRAFQGWRYLKPADAPPDRGSVAGRDEEEDIPPEMEKQLKEAGLL